MKTHTIAINSNHTEKRIAKIVLGAIGLTVALYAVLIAVATFSVVKRISFETKTKQLVSEINNLELSYLEQSEALDMMYAQANGFRDVTKTTFVAVPSVAYNVR